MLRAGPGRARQRNRRCTKPCSDDRQCVGVVGVAVHVPDVRHVVLLQVGVHALADVRSGRPCCRRRARAASAARQRRPDRARVRPAAWCSAPTRTPPIQAKRSRCARPKFSDWPPPIDSPARARLSRSVFTEYRDSIAGITSSSRSCSKTANAGAVAKTLPSGAVVLLRPAVGHDDDHRHGLAVGDQVVEQDVGLGEALPLRLVAADAVQQVEHGILLVLRVAGRRVDVHLAPRADRLRVVLDHLQLAVRDRLAPLEDRVGRFRRRRARRRAGGRRAWTCAPAPPGPAAPLAPGPRSGPAMRRTRTARTPSIDCFVIAIPSKSDRLRRQDHFPVPLGADVDDGAGARRRGGGRRAADARSACPDRGSGRTRSDSVPRPAPTARQTRAPSPRCARARRRPAAIADRRGPGRRRPTSRSTSKPPRRRMPRTRPLGHADRQRRQQVDLAGVALRQHLDDAGGGAEVAVDLERRVGVEQVGVDAAPAAIVRRAGVDEGEQPRQQLERALAVEQARPLVDLPAPCSSPWPRRRAARANGAPRRTAPASPR